MKKLYVFISSVMEEFSGERKILFDYLYSDALLGRFFEPFIFEILPAKDIAVSRAYLEQVERCDIYIGIFGRTYGFQTSGGISPTEMEFDYATSLHKTRLIFISNNSENERHPKEIQLIKKAEDSVVRKIFSDINELKTNVYAALINLLEEKEFIRTTPFDATGCKEAGLKDIDPERIRWFVRTALNKRNFPVSHEEPVEKILTHLNLLRNGKPVNAAILLFGSQPQRHFITAEVRCALFPGLEAFKPITSYQVYKGDLFQQIDRAVDFVLSRIDLYVGDRSQSVDVPTEYEIPPAAVKEAIVNAIAHRDYTSNASAQVMIFRNRLEVWNPGYLPFHLPVSKLKQPHGSFPANPLLAESLYLAGYIERMGTGIPDMVRACIDAGLKEPDLVQEESFKVILWRKEASLHISLHITPHDTPHDTPHGHVHRVILALSGEMSRNQLQTLLGIKDTKHFREIYLQPAIFQGWIEMTLPDLPKSRNQQYRLTEKGKRLQKQLIQEIKQ